MKGLGVLTPLGLATAVGGITSFALGWWLGWIEFVAVGLGAAIALAIAIPFVVGGHALQLSRSVEPLRVEVDHRSTSVLSVTNGGKGPSAPRVVEDRIGDATKIVDVPALAPGAHSQAVLSLPTATRAVIQVGPAVVAKSDPLGLMRRDLGRTEPVHLFVHPRITALPAMRSGFVKDLEGPTLDSSPAGDVAFHAIREYSPGDDVRHIHWMSTARTGTLMVRHFVDNRRPHLGVLVDDDTESITPAHFEAALEVVASQVVSAESEGRPLTAWVGASQILTEQRPASAEVALERLCVPAVVSDAPPLAVLYERMRAIDAGISALLIVCGERSADSLLPVVSAARRHGGVIVARRVESLASPIAVPGAKVVDFRNLDEFVAAWRGIVR